MSMGNFGQRALTISELRSSDQFDGDGCLIHDSGVRLQSIDSGLEILLKGRCDEFPYLDCQRMSIKQS